MDVINGQLQRLRTTERTTSTTTGQGPLALQRQQEEQRLNRLRGHYGLCRRSKPAAAPGEFQI